MVRRGCAGIVVALLVVAATAEEAANSVEMVNMELVAAQVTRTVVLTDDEASAGEVVNRLSLRMKLGGGLTASDVLDGKNQILAGKFKDAEGKEGSSVKAAGNEAPRVRAATGGSPSLIELDLALPPENAAAITNLQIAIEATTPAQKGEVVIEGLRDRKAAFAPPGVEEAWYQVSTFGPRNFTFWRLHKDAPPLTECKFTNVRGDELPLNRLSSSTIADPSTKGWVSSLIFDGSVPLVVNLVLPHEKQSREVRVTLKADHVELP